MKNIILIIAIFFLCDFSRINVGGIVAVTNTIAFSGATLDLSRDGKDVDIATITISSNIPSYSLHLNFPNGAKFCSKTDTIMPYELKLVPNGTGSLGRGITALSSTELLPLINNEFIWSPEQQATATVDYGLTLRASWHINGALAGLYTQDIVATLNSGIQP